MLPLPQFPAVRPRYRYLLPLIVLLSLPVVLHGQTTWQGTVSSSWMNASNWNAGVPDSTISAIIRPGTFDPTVPVTGAYVASLDLDLNNNGVLNFENGAALTVHEVLTIRTGSILNLGGGRLYLKDDAIIHNAGSFNADSGTVEMSGRSWTNNSGAVFNAGSSTVIFNGIDQRIDGTIAFSTLVVRSVDTLSLTGTVTVTDSLHVVSGSTLHSTGTLSISPSAFIDLDSAAVLSITGPFNNDGTLVGTGTIVSTRPYLVGLGALNATTVDVFFDRSVDLTTAQTSGNYTISGGISVTGAARDGTNLSLVHLTVSTMTSNTQYTLTVNNVRDLSANPIASNTQKKFAYASSPQRIIVISGSGRSADVNTAFPAPFRSKVFDTYSLEMYLRNVTYTAPASGASGTFAGTGTNTFSVLTDGAGIAIGSTYTANGTVGSYFVTAAATGLGPTTSFSATNTLPTTIYTITATSSAGGSITPGGAVSVSYGSNQSFTIAANATYHIDSVKVDGVNQGAITAYTFTYVTANHTIAAYFSINTYTITASAGSGGTISPSGAVSVNHGSNQSFTISPNTGYHIDSVKVDGVNQGAIAAYTFTNVTAGHTIAAYFSINTYTITATAGAGGTISPSGAVSVNHGSNQSFTIAANATYHIDSVRVDGVNQGAIAAYTFTNVTAGHTIAAYFSINTYTITATAGSGGSISPSGAVTVNEGSNQSFTIAANATYHIDSVKVDGVNQGAIAAYTFTNVTAGHTIAAYFSINTYTITATASSGGSISPSGAVIVNEGSNQSFTIAANATYHIDSVKVDGVNQGAVTGYTFTNVTANHTIAAYFSINTHTITASAGSGGSISPSGAVTVNEGSNQSFTIAANATYHIDSVKVDGVNQGAITGYTFTNVTANHTIAAYFSINTYTITATASSGGSISPSGAVTVNEGSNQSFTIAANATYHIDSVKVDGVNQGAVTGYTFTNLTANHTIAAYFSINAYTITATAGAGGLISPSGAVGVSNGANQLFTITPNTGYHIDSVVVDGANQGAIAAYTFTNVTANHTIAAYFSINVYSITATAGANGSITPSGSVSVNHGSNQSFTIAPDATYHIDSVKVDGVNQGAIAAYTFTNVTANHTIAAFFSINAYTITATAGTGGTITPTGAVGVSHGANQSFTVAANTGYHIDSVVVDGVNQGAITAYMFTNVTANHTITAYFSVNTYTITATAGPGGSITPSGAVSVSHGSNRSFTIAPGPGFQLDSVVVDGVDQGAVTGYTFANVTVNHTIAAYFSIDDYTLSVTITGGGSVLIIPDQPLYPGGTIVQLTATPDDSSWTFSGWQGDEAGVANPLMVTMNSNKAITAVFTRDSALAAMYRSFLPESLALDVDNLGKSGRFVKRKPHRSDFRYHLIVPYGYVDRLTINFKSPIDRSFPFGTVPPSTASPVDGGLKKWNFDFPYPLEYTDTVRIYGYGSNGKNQKVTQFKWSRLGIRGGPDGQVAVTEHNILRLPKPNRVNIVFEIFAQGGFSADGGLRIGLVRDDSLNHYGWLLAPDYKNVMKSLRDRSVMHQGAPRGLNQFDNGKLIKKRLKKLSPARHNNRLLANLIALKVGIVASAMQKTRLGFGELIYDDGTANPLNGMMIRDISRYGDSLMMGWYNTGQHQWESAAVFENLDSTVRKIDASFEGPVDTISFATSLILQGSRQLGDVPYLRPNPGVIPYAIEPVGSPVEEVPSAYVMHQNYPNPFNPTTTIAFELPGEALVRVSVYNILGQEVALLADNLEFDEGEHEIDFDAVSLPSGVYFYRIEARDIQSGSPAFARTMKMMVVK